MKDKDKVELIKEFIKQEPDLVKYMLENAENLDPEAYTKVEDYLRHKNKYISFEEYFRKHYFMYSNQNKFTNGEFRIKINHLDDTKISFYIHPLNEAGNTMNGQIKGNRVLFEGLASVNF